jgi:pyochelin biosynthesis protein PchC
MTRPMNSRSERSAWLRGFHSAEPGAPILVCLPHAGGTASAYFPFSAGLRPSVEVQAVQYPGRQDRHGEPAALAMDDLVDGLAQAVRPVTERPYALFGHSMGSVVAYELALRLERDGRPGPRWFFASGRRAPSRARPEYMHRRPDDELLAHVAGLGGLGGGRPELFEDPDVRAMVLPALRADYTLVENYRADKGGCLNCPVTVLIGTTDPLVDVGEAAAWQEHTSAAFELRSFPGGHFYLTGHVPALAEIITDRLIPLPATVRSSHA